MHCKIHYNFTRKCQSYHLLDRIMNQQYITMNYKKQKIGKSDKIYKSNKTDLKLIGTCKKG